MVESKNKKLIFSLCFLVVFLAASFLPIKTEASFPYLANYYLGELNSSSDFINRMSQYDLLILTPSQIKTHSSVVRSIRSKNSDIIILAYVPSQSYNFKYWPQHSVYSALSVNEDWWLRDSQGNRVSTWEGIYNIDMNHDWSRYLVSFVNEKIASLYGVDGIFFDMVSESISWANGGDIDFDNNGIKDSAYQADGIWLERAEYLLDYAQNNLNTDYVVINGSSHNNFQEYTNGRMFENFPTPWENNGAWSAIMNAWVKNKQSNNKPFINILNTNTGNTGNNQNFKSVRFGLVTSLLEDGYFSYDYGDENHGQTWWYDEYDIDLGDPLGSPVSQNNYSSYNPDVWSRDFSNGLAIVNSTNQAKTVDLGGEYEKIRGTQDSNINDGSIITETVIDGYDGLLLLKTFDSLQDVLFRNGDFVRFFDGSGGRVRNGFFVFEDGYKGGDQIAHIDLDGNGKRDLLVVSRNKIMAWRDDGMIYMKIYPYTAMYRGGLRVAIGDLNKDSRMEIYVSPEAGYNYPIKVYTRHGRKMKNDWYPYGESYTGGYSLSVLEESKSAINRNSLLVAKASGEPLVTVFDYNYQMAYQWLAFDKYSNIGVNVSTGDFDGDKLDEIVVGAGEGFDPIIRVFDKQGNQLYNEFEAYGSLTKPGIEVLTSDVNYDGKDDIVGMSNGF